MAKDYFYYFNKVMNQQKKTNEEKRVTQHYKFVNQSDYSSKKKQYDTARKKMNLAPNDNVTGDEFKRMMGNPKTGDTGEFARWNAYNEKRKAEINNQRKARMGPPTPKKLDVNNQWADRRKSDAKMKSNARSLGTKVDDWLVNKGKEIVKKGKQMYKTAEKKDIKPVIWGAKAVKGAMWLGDKADQYVAGPGKNLLNSKKPKGTTGKDTLQAHSLSQYAHDVADQFKSIPRLFQRKNYEGLSDTVKKSVTDAWSGKKRSSMKEFMDKNNIKTGSKVVNKALELAMETSVDPTNALELHAGLKLGKKAVSKTKVGKAIDNLRNEESKANAVGNATKVAETVAKASTKALPKSVQSQVNEVIDSVKQTTKANAEKVKQATPTARQDAVEEILKAMGKDRGKVPEKNAIDSAKFDEFDNYLNQAKSDLHNREMVQGYKESVADKPKSIDEMVNEIKANRDPKSVEHYQERYKALKDYVDEKYKGQNVNDDIINEAWSHIANRDEDFNVNELVDRAFPKGSANAKANVTEEMAQQYRKNQAEFGQDDAPLNRAKQMPRSAEGTARNELYKIQRRMAENQIQDRLGRQWASRLGVKQPVAERVPTETVAPTKREYTPQEIQMAQRLGMQLPNQQEQVKETVTKLTGKGKRGGKSREGGAIKQTADGRIDLNQYINPKANLDHKAVRDRIMKDYGLTDQEASKVYFEMMDESRAPKKKADNPVMKIESGAPTLERTDEGRATPTQASPTLAQANDQVNDIVRENAGPVPLPDNYNAMDKIESELVDPKEEKPSLKEKTMQTFKELHRLLIDKTGALKDIDKTTGEDVKIGARGVLPNKHLETGTAGRIKQQFKKGFYDFSGKKTGDSFTSVFNGVKDVKKLMGYMSAKRIQDYDNRLGNLITDEKGNPVLDAMGNPQYEKAPLTAINSDGHSQTDISNLAIEQYEKHHPQVVEESKKVEQLMDNQIGILRDGGFFNDEMLAEMKADNPNYLPFQRDRSDVEQSFLQQGRVSGSSGEPIKARTGSTRKIISPEQTLMKRQIAYNVMADRNRTNQAMLDAAISNPNNGYVKLVGEDENYLYRGKQKIDGEEVEQDMLSHVDDLAQGSDKELADGVDGMFTSKKGGPNIIYAYKDGNRYHLKITNEAIAVAHAANNQTIDMITKALSLPTDMLRWGVTMSPDFAVRNWGRDQFTTMLTSPVGYRPVVDSLVGASHIIRNKLYEKGLPLGKESALLHAWESNGGSMDVLKQMSDLDLPKEYEELMKKPGVRQVFKDIMEQPSLLLKAKESAKVGGKLVKAGFTPLAKASEFSELSTRIGHMNRAMKYSDKLAKKNMKLVEQGKMSLEDAQDQILNERDATYIAKSVMDFSRSGEFSQKFNRTASFFNPWIQGLDTLGQAMKKRPVKTAASVALGLTLPSLILHMNNSGEDWYEEIPRQDRDMNWYIKPKGVEHPIKIAKPFEPGVLFASLPERMYDRMINGDKGAYDGYLHSMIESLTPSIQSQLLKPWIEAIYNYNSFTGRPIESMGDEYKDVPDRKNVFSSQVAIQTSKALSNIYDKQPLSPKKIDHLIRGYGGTLTDFLNKQVVDRSLRAVNPNIPERPSAGIEDMPFVSSFIQKNAEGNNQSTNDFYDLVDKLSKAKKKVPEGGIYKEDNQRLAANRTMRQIQDLQTQKTQIQEDLKMGGAKKGEEIKKLNKQITKLAREGLATYKNSK